MTIGAAAQHHGGCVALLSAVVFCLGACSSLSPAIAPAPPSRAPLPTPTAPPPPAVLPPTEARDGPPVSAPADPATTPDARPQFEPIRPGVPDNPEEALGPSDMPQTRDTPFRQRGIASWYGRKFHGRRTASGEIFDMHAMTAAHPTLPLPSYVRVRNPANGAEVVLRVNDRGPFHRGRIIDLSHGAALKLGVLNGVAAVELERITVDEARELVPRVREGLERVPRVPRRR